MKILSPWPWPQDHPWGGDGADKNFRPISTIMPNMNEIHQRVFKIWGLINFNAKTLTLWRKDERTHERTNVRTNERTNGRTEKRKLYTPTYFVCRGYKYTWDKTKEAISDKTFAQPSYYCLQSRMTLYILEFFRIHSWLTPLRSLCNDAILLKTFFYCYEDYL